MTANLAIDPQLIARALQVSGEKTESAAVTKALEEYISRHDPARLLDLVGQLDWDPDYDYKKERGRSDEKLGFK